MAQTVRVDGIEIEVKEENKSVLQQAVDRAIASAKKDGAAPVAEKLDAAKRDLKALAQRVGKAAARKAARRDAFKELSDDEFDDMYDSPEMKAAFKDFVSKLGEFGGEVKDGELEQEEAEEDD